MKNIKILSIAVLLSFSSCFIEIPGIICTDEYVMIMVSIKDSDGNFIKPDEYYRAGRNRRYGNNAWPIIFEESEGSIIIFTDSEQGHTGRKGVWFNLTAYKDELLIADEDYLIGFDGCHVALLEGNTELVYEEKPAEIYSQPVLIFIWFIPYPLSASAPAVISFISVVIAAWRALLYTNFRSLINCVALSVAMCMAVMRAPCSEANESKKAL